ncbi:MAG TPA: AraC family transcriptional regulator, partial [Candidatus Aquilonibacter sp.]
LVLKPGLHEDPALAKLLLAAHACANHDRVYSETTWAHALELLFSRYGDPRPKVDSDAVPIAGLHLAREYLIEHFRDNVSIGDLARLAGVSRAHFIRAFHAAFGMPPHAYINQLRLQCARKLLLAGVSATDAAAESGFYDQSRLTRVFRRAYGVTPTRYAHLTSV